MSEKDAWACGWEDARRRQLTAGLEATPAQRLAWLEEMILLAYLVRARAESRRARNDGRSRRAS